MLDENTTTVSSISDKNKIHLKFNKIKEIVNNASYNTSNYQNLKSNNLSLTLPNLSTKMHNSSRNIFDNFLKSSKYNENKTPNCKNSFYNTKQNYIQANSNLNTNYITKSSISMNRTIKKKTILNNTMRKNIIRKTHKFPYEDNFLNILKNDFNNYAKEKLFLTKKVGNNLKNIEDSTKSQEDIPNQQINNSTNNNSNTITYTEKNNDKAFHTIENCEKKSRVPWNTKNILLTEVDTLNDIKVNNKFFYTESFFKTKNYSVSKRILNNKTFTNMQNFLQKKGSNNNTCVKEIQLITENSIESKDNCLHKKSKSTTKNKAYNYNIIHDTNNDNKILFDHKNIKHPYVAPLTLIKLQKFKIFDENAHYLEEKKRYEMNQKKNYKSRGLNL
jgi:hypothetical protein